MRKLDLTEPHYESPEMVAKVSSTERLAQARSDPTIMQIADGIPEFAASRTVPKIQVAHRTPEFKEDRSETSFGDLDPIDFSATDEPIDLFEGDEPIDLFEDTGLAMDMFSADEASVADRATFSEPTQEIARKNPPAEEQPYQSKLLNIMELLVPVRHREAVLGDLREDLTCKYRCGWSGVSLRAYELWQCAMIIAEPALRALQLLNDVWSKFTRH